MRAKVIGIIRNSPFDMFTAEEIVEFSENENVFDRVHTAREQFKKRYGEDINLEIHKVEWLS